MFFGIFVLPVFALTGTIDSTNRYAWSENAGWIDFGTTLGNVVVTDSALTGYAYGENIGWISLNCSNTSSCATVDYKVANNGQGVLSGYAWGENVGWINFAPSGSGVTIDSSGNFSGYAYGENMGWIKFDHSQTASRPVTTWLPDFTAPIILDTYQSLGDLSNSQPATITWTTDEASSTQVEYGLTNSYGSTTTETDTTTRVTSHTATISLTPCQFYYFRVISKDQASNQVIGDGFTMQTHCLGGAYSSQNLADQSITLPSAQLQSQDLQTDILDPRIALMERIVELLKEIIKILMKRKGLI